MKNRYFDIRKDFYETNEFQNVILPIINEAKFKSKEDKERVINWSRTTFFNQWKTKGGNQ
jgi:hypothetical protein